MSDVPLTTLRIARLVLEAGSPLSIATGKGMLGFDSAVVLDANGLPTLPATSIKGVLRSRYRQQHGVERERRIFGFAEDELGAPAKLRVSWGWCHDSRDEAVVGRLIPDPRYEYRFSDSELVDPLLCFLREQSSIDPLVRDRVRINARGTADDAGKFDRTIVPKGVRFTIQVEFEGATPTESIDEADWSWCLSLLLSGDFRVGGSTRAGLGLLQPVRSNRFPLGGGEQRFALDPSGLDQLRQFRHSTQRDASLSRLQPITATNFQDGGEVLSIELVAPGTWRFGGGQVGMIEATKEADTTALREPVIVWQESRDDDRPTARICSNSESYLVAPGSSVKGAIRHRTGFHFRRLTGVFVGASAEQREAADAALDALFGCANNENGGCPGLIIIHDVHASLQDIGARPQGIKHVSIDRFTGGARQGKLFDEEVLVGGRLKLQLKKLDGFNRLAPELKQAFDMALADLRSGRLPLGASSSRGHGRFIDAECEVR